MKIKVVRELNIYGLGLHEEILIGKQTSIMRVPGGWIYYLCTNGDAVSQIFVPYNQDFIEVYDEQ